MMRIVWITLVWFVPALTANAASFDCAKAATKVEKLICSEAEISKLDEELSSAYKAVLKDEKQDDTVKQVQKQVQKQWMKERNDCSEVVCVKRAYEGRLLSLAMIRMTSGEPMSAQSVDKFKYRMIQGSGNAICEQMFKRMNEELVRERPVCAFDLLTAIPSVVLPEWKKLDLQENKLLYKRFVLANLVREKYYPQIFGEVRDKVDTIRIPTNDQMVLGAFVQGRKFGAPMTEDQLEGMWKDAADHGYEFYRWDGAFSAPDEADVLLVEVSRFDELNQTKRCPKFRVLRISADMRLPKQWQSGNAKWLIGPEAIPFKYDNQYYRLVDEGVLVMDSVDKETQVRALPIRLISIDAIRNDLRCFIQN